MSHLNRQLCLITGASRGIGRAIALQLGNAGATVIGTATGESGTAEIEKYLADNKIRGQAVVLNVADRIAIKQAVDNICTDIGMPTILVNNAGITRDNLLVRMKDTEWDEIMAVNLTAIFHLSRACIRHMSKARFGRIINIASVVAAAGNAGQSNYAAAKAGMIGFSKALAREVAARNITVNTIAPGFIATDMTAELDDKQRAALISQIPLARLGTPQEVAAAVEFLAGDSGNYITGATIHINGGMYMA